MQAEVDTQHPLIGAHGVANTGSDRAQLRKMALVACKASRSEPHNLLESAQYVVA